MLSTLLGTLTLAVSTATASPDASGDVAEQRFNLLGLQVCFGTSDDVEPCHVRIFNTNVDASSPKEDPDETLPTRISMFGKNICLGRVPDGTVCDVRLPASDASA